MHQLTDLSRIKTAQFFSLLPYTYFVTAKLLQHMNQNVTLFTLDSYGSTIFKTSKLNVSSLLCKFSFTY